MLWIIWTCLWFLVSNLVDLMSEYIYKLRGVRPSVNATGIESLVYFIIWIVGMVKFW